MTRSFFDQIDDELRGLLGPGLSGYRCVRTGGLIKLWFDDPASHFEAQRISARSAPEGKPVMEVGLHLEHSSARMNDRILEWLLERRETWSAALPRAEAGPAFGPRSARWRRLSELLDDEGADQAFGGLDDPDFAGEIAERLAHYVRILQPLLRESMNGE
ncbi:MAG: hypothetical protein ACRDJG_00300 [Actinomycetota bacterium]